MTQLQREKTNPCSMENGLQMNDDETNSNKLDGYSVNKMACYGYSFRLSHRKLISQRHHSTIISTRRPKTFDSNANLKIAVPASAENFGLVGYDNASSNT